MKVVLTETFKKQLKKLDAAISKRVLDYLEQIELLDNPRSRGKALTSNLSGYGGTVSAITAFYAASVTIN